MINHGLFAKSTRVWTTPQELFDKLNNIYNFDIDLCADDENAKCEKYFTEKENALVQDWRGVCWLNPPYGREIGKWIKKAYESSLNGATVVCLLPSRTDTQWFHDYCMKGSIEFMRGRLKFGDCDNSAPFPSMIVVFRGRSKKSLDTLIKVTCETGNKLLELKYIIEQEKELDKQKAGIKDLCNRFEKWENNLESQLIDIEFRKLPITDLLTQYEDKMENKGYATLESWKLLKDELEDRIQKSLKRMLGGKSK
jgi:phage N-6-adenine-methyltransferase